MSIHAKKTIGLISLFLVGFGLLLYQGKLSFSNFFYAPTFMTENHDHSTPSLASTDPSINLTLSHSTFFGAAGIDEGYTVAIDTNGNIYIAGITDSTILPTKNALNASYNGGAKDAFLVKFFKNGSLAFSTYWGGSGQDGAYSMVVNATGTIFLTGYTGSTNFPTTPNALNKTLNGGASYDRFVSQFTTDGQLLYSTYWGGTGSEYMGVDRSNDLIAVDNNGSIIIAGCTSSANLPTTPKANDTSFNGGSYDTFVTKFYANFSLAYSSYFGGSGADYAIGLGADNFQGGFYITGSTDSTNLPMYRALNKTAPGNGDAFVTYFNLTGGVDFSTYWGGSGITGDAAYSLEVDQTGNVSFVGYTSSANFPLKNPFDPTQAYCGGDGFITTFTAEHTLAFSTFLGGTYYDIATDVKVDAVGEIYVTGSTDSANFPMLNAYDSSMPDFARDTYIMILSSNGSLKFSTFIGSDLAPDDAKCIALGSTGMMYIVGITESPDYPTTLGAFDTTINASEDAFLSILTQPKSAVPNATQLSINASTSANGAAKLSWSVASGAAAYKVYRETTTITQVTSLTPIAPNVLVPTYIDTGLTNGTYYYVVVATNANGDSNASNCVSVIVAIPPTTIPNQPPPADDPTPPANNTSGDNETGTEDFGIPGYPLDFLLIGAPLIWILIITTKRKNVRIEK